MKHYKTVNEVKEHLPEILERINDLKIYFDIATMMLEDMQNWCVDECIHPEHDYGWWTTAKAYSETLLNQVSYLTEIEYLTGLLKRLPQYKNNVI